jgi:hypothetical protein
MGREWAAMGRGAAIAVRSGIPYGRADAVHHGTRTHRYIVHAKVILDKRRVTSHKHVRLDNHNPACHNDASIKSKPEYPHGTE